MTRPTVSVIIPTYNHARLLEKALASVFAQTFKEYEVIVVNDGSTDDTAQVVAKFGTRVKYIEQANRGVSSARNRGIRESRGRYIAFLDPDDTWFPDKLEKQITLLEARTELGFVYASARAVDEDGNFLGNKPDRVHSNTLEELLRRNFIPTLTVVVRREFLEGVGYFDEELSGPEDYHLWLRLATRHPFYGLPEAVATYLVSKNSLSRINPYGNRIMVREKLLSDPLFTPHRSLLKTRLAVDHYLWATELYRRRLYRSATRHFAEAIHSQPQFGRYFVRETDGEVVKLFKQVKPYLATAVSGLLSAFDFKESG